jgi:hypothetical protein
MGVIFTLSARPSLAPPFAPLSDMILRKLARVAIYAVFTILVYRALRRHIARPTHAWLECPRIVSTDLNGSCCKI